MLFSLLLVMYCCLLFHEGAMKEGRKKQKTCNAKR